jgi:hypothetical protein
MRYFFTPSLLAAVAVAGRTSNEATAMSVNKEPLIRKDARGSRSRRCGSGAAGTAVPGGAVMPRRRCGSENQMVATESVCQV